MINMASKVQTVKIRLFKRSSYLVIVFNRLIFSSFSFVTIKCRRQFSDLTGVIFMVYEVLCIYRLILFKKKLLIINLQKKFSFTIFS